MCLMVLVAAGRPLLAAPIDPQVRHIAVLALDSAQGVGYHAPGLTLRYRYEVTSRYGCGCALRLQPQDLWALASEEATEEEELSARETVEDLQRLADLVEIGRQAGPVELYAAVDSDLAAMAAAQSGLEGVASRRTVALADFRRPGVQLVERQLVTITPDGDLSA